MPLAALLAAALLVAAQAPGAQTVAPAASVAPAMSAASVAPPASVAPNPSIPHPPIPPISNISQLLAITYDAAAGFQPTVRVGPVLAARQLEQAALSGLPIRIRFRVELWRDRLFDQLVDSTSWSTVIVYEPLGQQFFVRTLPASAGSRRYGSFTAARATVETDYLLSMRPPRPGRYYYTTSIQVETLSLGDLEELERWLQGELQPAVSGQRSVPSALGQGAKRLMLRLLDLPQRRVDARTDRFSFPARD